MTVDIDPLTPESTLYTHLFNASYASKNASNFKKKISISLFIVIYPGGDWLLEPPHLPSIAIIQADQANVMATNGFFCFSVFPFNVG